MSDKISLRTRMTTSIKAKLKNQTIAQVEINLNLDSSGNSVTQSIIPVTDSSGNLVTGQNFNESFVLQKNNYN